MFPKRINQAPRTLVLTLVITFISGANFFSIIMFWPTQAFNVYGQDPVGVGIRGLPVGFSILAGACIVLWLLSVFRGHNKELMIISSILMTAGTSLHSHDILRLSCSRELLVITYYRLWISCSCKARQSWATLGITSPGWARNRWNRCSSVHHHDDYLP